MNEISVVCETTFASLNSFRSGFGNFCSFRMEPVPGERLSKFSNVWQDFKASPEVVKLLKFGHKIKFETQPKLSLPQVSHETKLSPVAMKVIKKEILDLFHKGAMRKVSDDEANRVLGFYSKLFVVPKPEKGKFRVIINMMHDLAYR